MIHSEQRSLLTDALTPPAGYQFECGLATTFSLDLVTLLTLPMQLAWMAPTQSASEEFDPLAVLEALRRTAGRLTVFCERGRLQTPRSASPLLGLLEGMVHETSAPHGGSFHPKIWLLKFAPEDSADPVAMRLLILSRNVTDDRSWDISLRLDGPIGRTIDRRNAPLQEFLKKVVNLSHKDLSYSRQKDFDALMHDVARARWELPGKFEDFKFHALGVGQRPAAWLPTHNDGRWDELAVISPFVSSEALEQLSRGANQRPFLISRSEELDRLAAPIPGGFQKTWVMEAGAQCGDDEDDTPGRERGLHAKIYACRRGWYTHLFVGSANATAAALVYGHNVEFMAELIGKSSAVGKPESWQTSEGLLPLLTAYNHSPPPDPEREENKKVLEQLRKQLCEASLNLQCESRADVWALHLHGIEKIDPGSTALHIWPVTLNAEHAVQPTPASAAEPVLLGILPAQHITSLTAFCLRRGTDELSFVLDLPLHGAPADRELELLRATLRNKEGFVRYLLLLLGDWELAGGGEDGSGSSPRKRSGGGFDNVPLFEMLVRAYAREPARLDQISKVIDRLQADGQNDDALVPDEFLCIWRSIETAMKDRRAYE